MADVHPLKVCAACGRKCPFELRCCPYGKEPCRKPQGTGGYRVCLECIGVSWVIRIEHDCNLRYAGPRFLVQLDPLTNQCLIHFNPNATDIPALTHNATG